MSDVHSSSSPSAGSGAQGSPTPQDTQEASAEHASASSPEAQEQKSPWYMRPWFWAGITFLAIVALLAWLFWHQWQAQRQAHIIRMQHNEALVAQQHKRNAELEAEIARLKALLAEDPCVIKEQLPAVGESLHIPPTVKNKETALSPAPQVQEPQKPAPATTDTEDATNTKPHTGKSTAKSAAEAPPPPPLTEATTPAHAPSMTKNNESSMAQKLEDATVLVLSQEPSGLQMGTGFFIAPGIVLTNQHVVGQGKGAIYVVGTFQGTATKAKALVISPNAKRDYAVLQVPVTDVAPLKLTTQVERTQKVSTWGFPSAVTDNDPKFKNLMNGTDTKAPDVIYSEGTVSVIQEQDPSLIVHSAIVSQGNSGGPLVNEQGEVVGINTYIHMDKQSYRQSSLSIVTQDIIKFLQEHSIPFTLSSGHKE